LKLLFWKYYSVGFFLFTGFELDRAVFWTEDSKDISGGTYVWLGFWVLVLSMGQPGAPVLNAVFTRVWALKKKIGPFVGNARVFASNY
jgi:hypothetical protein